MWGSPDPPEPCTHLHDNPQILDIVLLCLDQLIQDKPEQEIKNNEGSSSLPSKKSSHLSSQESCLDTLMTRPPQAPRLAPRGQVLTGVLCKGPLRRAEGTEAEGASQMAYHSQGERAYSPDSPF